MGLSNHQKPITRIPGCPGQVIENPVLEPLCKMGFITSYQKVQDGIHGSYRQGKICYVITRGELLGELRIELLKIKLQKVDLQAKRSNITSTA